MPDSYCGMTGISYFSYTVDLLFIIYSLGCILLVLWGLMRCGLLNRWIILIVAVWLLAQVALSASGFLANFDTFPPRMLLVLLIPMIATVVFLWSAKSHVFVKRIPPNWPVTMQSFRVGVELFLWWAFINQLLPRQMTFEGFNMDILVGLTAPAVSLLWLRWKEYPKLVIAWNIVGLLILFNIVIIAILSMPTPMRYFDNEPANTLVASFPWVMLPGILVALAFFLHIFSIKQMLWKLRLNKDAYETSD